LLSKPLVLLSYCLFTSFVHTGSTFLSQNVTGGAILPLALSSRSAECGTACEVISVVRCFTAFSLYDRLKAAILKQQATLLGCNG